MKSDPKDCLYCQNNETLHNLMIEIAQLSVSRVFLFKEQTYRGRCLVAYKDHVNDLNELTDEERNAFMADVARVTRAMQKAFNPEKINYGVFRQIISSSFSFGAEICRWSRLWWYFPDESGKGVSDGCRISGIG
jgi:hypothetical protein